MIWDFVKKIEICYHLKGGDEEIPEDWTNEGAGGNFSDGPYATKRVHDYYTWVKINK